MQECFIRYIHLVTIKKNEYIQEEVLFDTIKNKIIKEVKYNPAVLYKK